MPKVIGVEITLTPGECRMAVSVGCDRRLKAMSERTPEVYGPAADGQYWMIDIEAAGAEVAVAKALGLYWGPSATAAEDRLEGDLPGGVQVRWTPRAAGKLILHQRDADHHTFYLVVGCMPRYTVVGRIAGRDGKRPEFWWTQAPRPAFFVPQEQLEPLA